MSEKFGILPCGEEAHLYTISCGGITAKVTDFGANLTELWVPDAKGQCADVVLGHSDCLGYLNGTGCLGATVGRNANRIQGAAFTLGGKEYKMTPNENDNNLHSGPDLYYKRMWKFVSQSESSVTLALHSPDGDQGFPGNADITVTYALDTQGGLHIRYEGSCDADTVFNLTNHSYFNLAGHEHTEKAKEQLLWIPGEYFLPDDAKSIPTGEKRSVAGSPMDFRSPKAICTDMDADYDALNLQGGYDHNYEAKSGICASLEDLGSGRKMTVETDCPGVQFYGGNFLNETGKNGVYYGKHSGIALETQFYPDCIHHADWDQPIVKAGETYRSETVYRFTW